jgi:hypothetical protein
MDLQPAERVEVLITVKAAPEIGRQHGETVCVAGLRLGLLAAPTWIRLFPVPWKWFSGAKYPKYEVIEVDVRKHASDPRPESYRPLVETARPLRRLTTWRQRGQIVGQLPRPTMCDLVRDKGWGRTSLAVICPAEVTGFTHEYTGDSPEYLEKQLRALQGDLFDQQGPQLELCPYVFRLHYLCRSLDCSGHHQTIVDWEISEAWRTWRDDYPGDFLDRIKTKWLDELCAAERGPEFFVGNQKNAPQAFMVLGIYRSRA